MSAAHVSAEIRPCDAELCHPGCIVCSSNNGRSLGVHFEQQGDGSVRGTFQCEACYEGYPGRLHGGVIAMLLDAAMTHCLFSCGIEAVTAKLNLEYRRPVMVEHAALLRAHLTADQSPLFRLAAVLVQQGEVRARATAVFFKS